MNKALILVVEDDRPIRNLIVTTLKTHDYKYITAENGKAKIQVEDNGPGICDEMKPHIFEMFYTGKNTIADSHRSLGLGLALCRSIIEVHNGKLVLEDNTPHGCIFSFTLPLSEVTLNE